MIKTFFYAQVLKTIFENISVLVKGLIKKLEICHTLSIQPSTRPLLLAHNLADLFPTHIYGRLLRDRCYNPNPLPKLVTPYPFHT